MTPPPPPHDPIAALGNLLNKTVTIKCKRYKTFKGILKSFNAHLNVLLEEVTYNYHERDETVEDTPLVERTEKMEKVILRGDSIVFIGLTNE